MGDMIFGGMFVLALLAVVLVVRVVWTGE